MCAFFEEEFPQKYTVILQNKELVSNTKYYKPVKNPMFAKEFS